jgi:acid phosphatase type 7
MNRAVAVIITVFVSAGCGSGSSTSPSPVPSEPAVLVGAGDIGDCATRGSGLTAQLLDRTSGTVFTAGDNAYPSGTAANYRDCYDPTWGRHRGRTRPSPGNHEYEVSGAAAYFQYFGDRAGTPGLGYYSYSLGAWHVLSLNSEVGNDAGSGQMAWLRAELASNQARCEVAYFHKPLFSSGLHGDQRQMQETWRTLYEFGVDIVVAGHDHNYERFAPQDHTGRFDAARGIRQFVVGTGGTTLRPVGASHPNSEVHGASWGVLVLTLEESSYRWEFVPAEPGGFQDAGVGQCH